MRKTVIAAIWLTMALALYGGWADFIPSRDWSSAGSVIAAALSFAATVLFVFAYSTGRARFKPGSSRLMKGGCYLAIPFMLFGFIWFAIVHGAASCFTLAFGNPAATDVVAWKEVSRSRRTCDHRLRTKELGPGFQFYVCISEHEYSALPERSTVTFTGLRSPLGFAITSWQEAR